MATTRIFIGPFHRRSFSDALKTVLEQDSNLTVSVVNDQSELLRHVKSESPAVIIMENSENAPVVEQSMLSPMVVVVLISDEGNEAQIALSRLNIPQLRHLIGLAEKGHHPKVISISTASSSDSTNTQVESPCENSTSLAPIIDWLNARFSLALENLVDARDGDVGGWGGDVAFLTAFFNKGNVIDIAEESRRFEVMVNAPLWCQAQLATFKFNADEIRAIALVASPELDQRYGAAIGLLQNNYAEPRPNATTLAQFFGPDLVGADFQLMLKNHHWFNRFGVIQQSNISSHRSHEPQPSYCVAPPIMELLLGQESNDGIGWSLQSCSLSAQAQLTETILEIFDKIEDPIITISAAEKDAADEISAAVISAGMSVLRASAAQLTTNEAFLSMALRARLNDAVLILEDLSNSNADILFQFLNGDLAELTGGLVLLGCPEIPKGNSTVVSIKLSVASTSDRARRWSEAIRSHGIRGGDALTESLSARLRFGISDINQIARLAAVNQKSGTQTDAEVLIMEAARQISLRQTPNTVRRPPCIFDWSDLVLPEKILEQVKAVPAQVINSPKVLNNWGYSSRLPYGRGIGALFCGHSGTGKTMCAQVIANSLCVDLMQVELSRCVSKYIGETEKNIDMCFEAAESASALLLFDEADALFGKRTEIKDAHDRHANVEVAYLLQRIEAYEGLVILTSNLKANIDTAFLRRLRFVIDFPMPAAEERLQIWQRAIPAAAPCADDVNVEFLARSLELSGGSIQQVAVNAAFAAASDSGLIEMRHIMGATRDELIKMGMFSAERSLIDTVSMTARIGDCA